MSEIVKQGGALAIRPDQTGWTDSQAAVLRQSGIDEGVVAEELSAFLHLCQRTRLDPFSRQIYLIGRWDSRQQRKVYTPQTSIDGYRVIAHRAAAEAGHALGYEDTLWCAKDGRWQDVWLSDGPPAAAKVTVIRNGMRFSAVARYSEYAQTKKDGGPSGLWGKMPATMTAKCAEALALRMAFPHDLAGVYTAEEMAQADNPAEAERHLRTVRPGEPDPWATAGPQQPASGRDFVAEARGSTDTDTVRQIWLDAKAAGLSEKELGWIASVGTSLAAGPPPPKPDDADEVHEGEIVPGPTELAAQQAETELRAFAEQQQIGDIAAAFEAAHGMPLDQAIAEQIRAFHQQLAASAA